jgi:hypothetical protein
MPTFFNPSILSEDSDSDVQTSPIREEDLINEENEFKRLFNFDRSRTRLHKLVRDWEEIRRKAEDNRLKRNFEIDADRARADGELEEDDVIISMRVINENMEKEKPAYVRFLRKSRRLLVFEDKNDPGRDNTDLDRQFARGMTYQGWSKPHTKQLDGAQLHGWDSVEIVFDRTKPFNIALEHIGYESFIFHLTSKNFQDDEEVVRQYDVSVVRLESLAQTHEFDIKQVNMILTEWKEKEKSDLIKVYKRWHKYKGAVYVSWFVDESEETSTNWLRAPVPLYLGDAESRIEQEMSLDPMTGLPIPVMKEIQVPKQETKYPVKMLCYMETEDPKLIDKKGRAFHDKSKQQAQTALWSTYINWSLRSSHVFASPEIPSGSGSLPERQDLELVANSFYSEPMKFWNLPGPSLDLIRAGQFLDTKTQEERGGIASSVINRQDARKTSAEIKAAEGKETELDSVKISNYSDYVSDVYVEVWRLVKAQAISGLITLLPLPTGEPGTTQNDLARLKIDYNLKAAGDVDVIEKEEDLQKRVNLWPIVGASPIALPFLSDLLRKAFPEDGERYALMLEQAQVQQAQMQGLMEIIQAMALDDTGQLKPEFKEFGGALKGLGVGNSGTALTN